MSKAAESSGVRSYFSASEERIELPKVVALYESVLHGKAAAIMDPGASHDQAPARALKVCVGPCRHVSPKGSDFIEV